MRCDWEMAAVSGQNAPRYFFGLGAGAISLVLAMYSFHTPLLFIAACYLAIICVVDTLFAKVPNLCNLGLLIVGVVFNVWVAGAAGAAHAFLGLLVGFSLLLLPYLMGGMGGGDVKALAALGALLGPVTILQVFVYIALFGGLFSILHYLFASDLLNKIVGAGRALLAFAGTRDAQTLRPEVTEKLRFPYASAIAFGFFSYVQWGSIFSLLKSF
ncbi:prepilin peptidase [Geoalkalibacter halelectricus]|uniref:prepilin peptidase n=1 Tax=Geoalkalibacter halelectricus TaxID=2847045 RepID=UPI003D1C21E1